MERENLPDILHEILKDLGGRASMMDVFKNFWKKYKGELRESDDIFTHGITTFVGLQLN